MTAYLDSAIDIMKQISNSVDLLTIYILELSQLLFMFTAQIQQWKNRACKLQHSSSLLNFFKPRVMWCDFRKNFNRRRLIVKRLKMRRIKDCLRFFYGNAQDDDYHLTSLLFQKEMTTHSWLNYQYKILYCELS